MRYMSVLSVPLLALLASPAMAQSHRVLDNGVVVVPAQAGAAQVRLELVDDNIVRVSADPDGDFKRTPSLMRVPVQGKPRFTVEQGGGNLRLVAAGISAEISEADGHVSFRDAEGKPLLAERAGGRSFSPLSVEGKAYYSVRQRFESPSDEAIYGFGQHQQGWMNQKGARRRAAPGQHRHGGAVHRLQPQLRSALGQQCDHPAG